MSYQPPCTLTPLMLTQVAEIVALLTRWSVAGEAALLPQLGNGRRCINGTLIDEQAHLH